MPITGATLDTTDPSLFSGSGFFKRFLSDHLALYSGVVCALSIFSICEASHWHLGTVSVCAAPEERAGTAKLVTS